MVRASYSSTAGSLLANRMPFNVNVDLSMVDRAPSSSSSNTPSGMYSSLPGVVETRPWVQRSTAPGLPAARVPEPSSTTGW